MACRATASTPDTLAVAALTKGCGEHGGQRVGVSQQEGEAKWKVSTCKTNSLQLEETHAATLEGRMQAPQRKPGASSNGRPPTCGEAAMCMAKPSSARSTWNLRACKQQAVSQKGDW